MYQENWPTIIKHQEPLRNRLRDHLSLTGKC